MVTMVELAIPTSCEHIFKREIQDLLIVLAREKIVFDKSIGLNSSTVFLGDFSVAENLKVKRWPVCSSPKPCSLSPASAALLPCTARVRRRPMGPRCSRKPGYRWEVVAKLQRIIPAVAPYRLVDFQRVIIGRHLILHGYKTQFFPNGQELGCLNFF